jgi:hypothetical protein
VLPGEALRCLEGHRCCGLLWLKRSQLAGSIRSRRC